MAVINFTRYPIHYIDCDLFKMKVKGGLPIEIRYHTSKSYHPQIESTITWELYIPEYPKVEPGDIVLIEKQMLPLIKQLYLELFVDARVVDIWVVDKVRKDKNGQVYVHKKDLYRVP